MTKKHHPQRDLSDLVADVYNYGEWSEYTLELPFPITGSVGNYSTGHAEPLFRQFVVESNIRFPHLRIHYSPKPRICGPDTQGLKEVWSWIYDQGKACRKLVWKMALLVGEEGCL